MKKHVTDESEMLVECRGGFEPLSLGPEWWNPVNLHEPDVRLYEPSPMQAMLDLMGISFEL